MFLRRRCLWEGGRRHVLKARRRGWCVPFGSRSLRLAKKTILGASMFLFLAAADLSASAEEPTCELWLLAPPSTCLYPRCPGGVIYTSIMAEDSSCASLRLDEWQLAQIAALRARYQSWSA